MINILVIVLYQSTLYLVMAFLAWDITWITYLKDVDAFDRVAFLFFWICFSMPLFLYLSDTYGK